MLIIIICLIALIVGMITYFKTREVPDWLNFSLIFSGIGINLIATIMYSNWSFIINSLAGLAFGVVIALIMFYGGQWGGGDSKMIMGLGALLGLNISKFQLLPIFNSFFVSFFVNMLLIGSIYGLIWISVLAVKNRKKIVKKFKELRHERIFVRIRWVFLFLLLTIIVIMFLDLGLMKFYLIGFILAAFFIAYLWNFVKAVEEISMIKKVNVEELTEGDWIVKDIIVNKKRICGPKDLGISRKQIKALLKLKQNGKIKKITIKEGIPFIPSFLLAFIVTIILGNLLTLILL